MAREIRVIPDIYFVEGEGMGDVEEGPKGSNTEDLIKEGFIPIQELTLEKLPEPIRTQQHLQLIRDFSKNVVRINNNRLSDQRPKDDQFKQSKEKSICGSGFLVNLQNKGVFVTTNRHVLFNEEELGESTFNIFFDSRCGDRKLYRCCKKGNGKFFLGKYSVDDVAHAYYESDDKMAALIKKNCPNTKELQRHLEYATLPGLGDDRDLKPMVCLISHPLGQPKHVSFGEMVEYDMKSRTVYHNAPSKPGSSGAPVIVFSKYHNLMAISTCHVGKCPETGRKFARVQYFEVSAVDIYDGFCRSRAMGKHEAKEEESTHKRMALVPSHLAAAVSATGNSLEQAQLSRSAGLVTNVFAMCKTFLTNSPAIPSDLQRSVEKKVVESMVANTPVETAPLAAFLPVFGAFLIQAEKTRLDGLDTSAFQPCTADRTEDSTSSCEMKPSVKKVFDKIADVAPSFTLCPPEGLPNTADLVSLLKPKRRCYCRSIVKMMERGVKQEDGTVTECYLTPHTVAAKMSSQSNVKELWQNRSNPDFQNDNPEEDCLLKKCLKLGDRCTIQVALLHMIVKANDYVRQLLPQANSGSVTSSSGDVEKEWEALYRRERSQRPSQQTQEKDSPTAEEEHTLIRLVYDVLTLHHLGLVSAALTLAVRPSNKDQTERDPNSPLSRCLAISEHALQHEQQSHRDADQAGAEDARCQCGRPGLRDVCVAHMSLTSLLEGRIHSASLCQTGGFLADSLAEMEACSVDLETAIQTVLKMMNFFTGVQQLVTHFLASGETFMYNYCLLAKYLSSLFQPRYCAFPVSVFGRPGSRPRQVTQPEVQDRTWETIKKAILASGFPPADLSTLEKDADRKQRFIDVFEDMKQLRREGRIKPDLFEERLERSNMCLFDYSHGGYAFEDCTHFFVWNVAFLLCPKFVGSCTGSRDEKQKPMMSLVQQLFDSGDDI